MKKKTHEEFVKEVLNKFGDDIEILSKYINNETKIKIYYKKCGHIQEIIPNNLLRSDGKCVKCKKKERDFKKHKQFVKRVYDKYGDKIEVLDIYVNIDTKIKIKYKKCGHIAEIIPSNLLSKKYKGNCNYCKGKILRKTHEKFCDDIYNMYGNEYSVLGRYKNSKTKILMKHNKCGNEWKVSPSSILSGHGCPQCFGKFKKTTEQFKQDVYDLVGDEYSVLGKYINSHKLILFKHNKCGNRFKMTPNNFLNGTRCPICMESKGEQKIRNWLEKNNIKFQKEYSFNNLLSELRNPLRFDFAIFDNNNILKCLIEYDGELHYLESGEWYNKKKLKIRQKYDKMKDIYCQQHNIPLLRIPYWEFDNIEKILEKYLNEVLNEK